MKFSTILWFILAIIGLFGALNSSAIFFGLFTAGIFLILLGLTEKKEKTPPTEQPNPQLQLTTTSSATPTNTCPNCGTTLNTDATFCPRCGERVRKE